MRAVRIAICSPRPDECLVDKLGWVADAFRLRGHDARRVHELKDIGRADAECDLVLFDQKNAGLNHNSLAELAHGPRRAVWVQWWRDLVAFDAGKPLAEQDHFRTFAGLMRGMDAVLVKERSLLAEYQSRGINAVWFDQACPSQMPAVDHPESPEWDVLVLGSTSYDQRRHDARLLAEHGYKVLWAGLGEVLPPGIEAHPFVHPLELPSLVERCKFVLGVDWRSDLPGYTSDRTHLAAGMGACYVARVAEYGAEHNAADYSPAAELAAWYYHDDAGLLEIAARARASQSERFLRGAKSRQKVFRRHCYEHRVDVISSLIAHRKDAKSAKKEKTDQFA